MATTTRTRQRETTHEVITPIPRVKPTTSPLPPMQLSERMWDMTDPAHPTLGAPLSGHTDYVNAVTFSPDGRTLATGSADQTVRLWSLPLSRQNLQPATQAAPAPQPPLTPESETPSPVPRARSG